MSDNSPFVELNDQQRILNLSVVWSLCKDKLANTSEPYIIRFEYGSGITHQEYFKTKAERDARYDELKEILVGKNLQSINDNPLGVITSAST